MNTFRCIQIQLKQIDYKSYSYLIGYIILRIYKIVFLFINFVKIVEIKKKITYIILYINYLYFFNSSFIEL